MSAVATPPAAPRAAAPGYLRGLITRFGANAASLSLSQVVKRSFRLVALLIVGRLLGPGLFGEYVLLLTVVEMVAVVSGAGYVDLLARDVAREHGVARRLSLRLTALRIVFIAAAGAVLLLILWGLRYSSAVLASAGLLLLMLFPRSLNESCQGVLRGRSKFTRLLWIEISQGIALVACVSAFLIPHPGLRGIIYAEILSALLGSAVAIAITAEFLKSSDDSPAALPPLRGAFAFNVFPLIVNVYDRADIVILSKLAGDFAVGIYGIPYRIYSMLQILPYGLMGALLPDFARATWNAESEARCRKLLQALYSAALVAILALWFIAPSFLVFILGTKFQLSEIPLHILVWAAIPMFLNLGMNTILLAAGRERAFIRTASVCTAVNLIGNLLLVPRFSFIAAAGVTVLTECVLLVQNVFLLRGIIGTIPLPRLFVRTSVFFVGTGLAATALKQVIPQAAAGILVTCLFATVCYCSEKAC